MAGGYPNTSFISDNAPASGGGVDTKANFRSDLVSLIANDGAVDVKVAFDQPGADADTTGASAITVKAGEKLTSLPIRSSRIAYRSTGAASAIRVIGHW